MKLSELTAEDVILHARVEGDDKALVPHILEAAKSYVLNYTGLTAAEADEEQELPIAALCLAADMLENRSVTAENSSENLTIKTILSMHCRNLIAGDTDESGQA